MSSCFLALSVAPVSEVYRRFLAGWAVEHHRTQRDVDPAPGPGLLPRFDSASAADAGAAGGGPDRGQVLTRNPLRLFLRAGLFPGGSVPQPSDSHLRHDEADPNRRQTKQADCQVQINSIWLPGSHYNCDAADPKGKQRLKKGTTWNISCSSQSVSPCPSPTSSSSP